MITVQTIVNAPIEKVWDCWTNPEHITGWCFASDDWHCPKASNDLRVAGTFSTTMSAKDGSFGFDFEGIYTQVEPNKLIAYVLADKRKVEIVFEKMGTATQIIEKFDPENENPKEMQQTGWQAILENFKKYVENQ